MLQSKAYVDTAMQMAVQCPSVYHKMQEFFEMYENGELLKQKKRSLLTEVGRKKAMQGQFSAKMQHFKMFQGLQVIFTKVLCWCTPNCEDI